MKRFRRTSAEPAKYENKFYKLQIGFRAGSSSRIHLSEATRDRLEKAGGYHLESRGGIEIKGKGTMNTYWLLGKKGFDKLVPTPQAIG